MKIGLVSSEIPPKINAGSVRMESFIDCWKEKENTELVVFTEANSKKEDVDYGDNVKMIRTLCKRASNKNGIIFSILSEILLSILILLKLLKSNVDIYFVSSPSFLLTISVLIASKIKSTPYIVDVRDIYPQVLFDNQIISSKGIMGRFLIKLEKMIYNNSLRVITVTKGLKKHIERKSKKRVCLIRNGVDTETFKRKEYMKDDSNFIILFHGTLGRCQDIDLIIEYANYLKENDINDIKIWIIGDGPKKSKILNSIKKSNLENILKYYGFKHISEIPDYINKSDIGFSPRKMGLINETAFPVKVYEYMGCGIPIIISPKSEVGEFVENNNIGFQVKGSKELKKLHNYVLKLKNNKEIYKNYSDNSLQTSTQFDRFKLANKLYQIITQIDEEAT